jgi:hypothetical protein
VFGFCIFERTKLFAPAVESVPPVRVKVIIFDATETESDPSRPDRLEAAVLHPELNVNPEPRDVGNVTTTLPSAGSVFVVVKDTVTFHAASVKREAGWTLVDEREPAEYVSAVL